jgi:hypothetical protein
LPQKPPNSMLKNEHIWSLIEIACRKRGGDLHKTQQQTAEDKTDKTCNRRKKTGNTGCWVVGLGDNLRGRRESVLKSVFSKPFHPTRFSVFAFSPPCYKALKASNHLLYSDSISSETLGFRASSIFLKSLIVMDRG